MFMRWLEKLIGLGPLKGYKTILAALLMMLARLIPGFPVIDIYAGVTPDQILLILAAIEKLLQKVKK
ncbi:MAG: hypothetical protein BWY21_00344 [Parcubacteria group bacterium ADurb.Bin216]|nr:MAG: hypothetical protein BWY21_00344 [Parcubacteria group bacterium ADurb.Bin216]